MVHSQCPSIGVKMEGHNRAWSVVAIINFWSVKVLTDVLSGYGLKLYRIHYSNFVLFITISLCR